MDELFFPASSSSCPSPASLISTAGQHQEGQEHDFVPCDVLEGWPGGGDWLWLDESPNGIAWGGEGSRSPVNNHLSGEPPAPALKRRGRKPGSRTNTNNVGPALCHVEAERQRRDKLNRLFCELRAAVPTVTRMDKASVLADAAAYITELRRRVGQLEAKAQKAAAAAVVTTVAPLHSFSSSGSLGETKLEVQMVGAEAAMLRLTTTAAARHAPARLMLALRSLDLPVQHACVCLVGGMTVQDAVVEVSGAALRDARALRAALLHRLQRTG